MLVTVIIIHNKYSYIVELICTAGHYGLKMSGKIHANEKPICGSV